MTIHPLNLSLDSELIEEIKIQAVREGRSVSDIAREVFREYLDRNKDKPKRPGAPKNLRKAN
jgi:plasmid stability protein